MSPSAELYPWLSMAHNFLGPVCSVLAQLCSLVYTIHTPELSSQSPDPFVDSWIHPTSSAEAFAHVVLSAYSSLSNSISMSLAQEALQGIPHGPDSHFVTGYVSHISFIAAATFS